MKVDVLCMHALAISAGGARGGLLGTAQHKAHTSTTAVPGGCRLVQGGCSGHRAVAHPAGLKRRAGQCKGWRQLTRAAHIVSLRRRHQSVHTLLNLQHLRCGA